MFCSGSKIGSIIGLFVGLRFGQLLGPTMVPKMVPRLVQKLVKNRCVFASHFGGFGALQVPLGSLFGPPETVLDNLGPKSLENYSNLRFSQMQVCGI